MPLLPRKVLQPGTWSLIELSASLCVPTPFFLETAFSLSKAYGRKHATPHPSPPWICVFQVQLQKGKGMNESLWISVLNSLKGDPELELVMCLSWTNHLCLHSILLYKMLQGAFCHKGKLSLVGLTLQNAPV